MARKKTPETTETRPRHEIIQRPMDEVMHLSMIPYAEHVILERALPRVEDGLKPVQRRILFTMNELGITPDKPHKKCARIVGDCLGKYHPHGDSSVYDAMVRMAQPYSLRGVLVDGHGNFGSIDGDSAAAMRYTEARMAPLALEMLRDIDKDTVPFSFNFDDTLKEPDMLPARYPNLLVNGASGIAVGLATNIPPHNLREAIDAAILLMDNPEASLEQIMQVMPAPDFPTGGCLIRNEEIARAYETGRGKLTVRAKVHIEDGTAGRKLIVITEVPYQVPKAAMLEKILKLSEERKTQLSGIYDIRDESDRTGLRAVIELKKDVDPLQVLSVLYKYSDLQITFGVNMVAIAEGRPMQMGVKAMLTYYIDHQKRVITRRTQHELAQARTREHILAGLMVAVNHLDEVIALIRKSKTPKEAKEQLQNRFGLTDVQAQAILDMRLQRLTGLEIDALRREYEAILKTISRLEGILKSEKKLIAVIRTEMNEIREKFGDDRRTQIIEDDSAKLPPAEIKPVAEDTAILRLRDGQLRRMSPRMVEKFVQQPGMAAEVVQLLQTTTDESLYVFTNLGNCFMLDVAKIPETMRLKERGSLLTGLIAGLADGENAVGMLCVRSDEMAKFGDVLLATKRGQIKRTSAGEYGIRRARFSAISLKGDDEVVALATVQPEDKGDVLLVTRQGMGVRFKLSEISATGRTTAGVRGVDVAEGDALSWVLLPAAGDMLLLISDRGWGKRMLADDIDRQKRATKGQKLLPMTKSGEIGTQLAALLDVTHAGRVAFTQRHGHTTEMNVQEIAVDRRTSKGQLLVSVLLDDTVTETNVLE
ncbi:MAG: DNA topoisomerase (ATP-hydrolyzing) [Christensenellales bacterium]|nr:DNA topoisomerase (ATP-hydrolyzing) [Christensenellales bacterium]